MNDDQDNDFVDYKFESNTAWKKNLKFFVKARLDEKSIN